MEDIFFVILIILSVNNMGVNGLNNFNYDYMNLKFTSSIRGIFVWLIILSHHNSYYKNKKYLYIKIIKFLGQKIVSLFLFYSGYGIYESLKRKGNNYAKTLLKKAIILFIKFQIIIFIFFLYNLILGLKFKMTRYLLSMIFITNVGNSNWFAFTIINFYLYSYLSFIYIKNKNKYYLGIIYINIIIAAHIYFTYKYFYPKKKYAIDNSFCFVLGFYYSFLKIYIDEFIMKDDLYYFSFTSLMITVYYYFYVNLFKNLLSYLLSNCFFCLIIIIISMKIKFYNHFLIFLNSHSFSIYLLQRIIMSFISYKKYLKNNEFIRLFLEFIAIISLSCLFDKYSKIDKLFSQKYNNYMEFIPNEKIIISETN